MAKSIMFLGTGSDVGKSVTVAAFCRIFKKYGFDVVPFKAQNMSNNSYITLEGGEIGRAQVVQAEACGLEPSVHMNPVLLKPSSDCGSQVVIHGKVHGHMDAREYHLFKPALKKAVMQSFNSLAASHDLVVMEGAGSCCEMNLRKNDLVNFQMAKNVNAPCILIADIDRGGVFAQILGSYQLMTPKEKKLTIGFIINKFRGDPRLFSDGIQYIEKKTGKPVFGLVPFFKEIHIDSEDSVSVQQDKTACAKTGPDTVNIAVIRVPSISNFTDMEILKREHDVVLNYLSRPVELTGDYDCIIIPGTKNVMNDTEWLSSRGWKKTIREFSKNGGTILGICGGYQILGEKIMDPYHVESTLEDVKGLGLLPTETILEKEKILRRVIGSCRSTGRKISGYEIHMGQTNAVGDNGHPFLEIKEPGKRKSWNDGWITAEGRTAGTYVHGIMDAPEFRGYFLNGLRAAKGLKLRKPLPGRLARFHQYDLLAEHFEKHCDVQKIISMI